jgi:hypothetical protein
MAQTRKWVMVPADFDHSDSGGIGRDDIELIIRLAKENLIDGKGRLLGRNGSFDHESHVAECLQKRGACQHFARFLELKANLSPAKPAKRKRGATPPDTIKKAKKAKLTGNGGDWDW